MMTSRLPAACWLRCGCMTCYVLLALVVLLTGQGVNTDRPCDSGLEQENTQRHSTSRCLGWSERMTLAQASTITEPARQIPIYERCEVLVVGGGPAGFTAAVSAAREGADVMLVERYGCLGGLSTG